MAPYTVAPAGCLEDCSWIMYPYNNSLKVPIANWKFDNAYSQPNGVTIIEPNTSPTMRHHQGMKRLLVARITNSVINEAANRIMYHNKGTSL